VSETAVAVEHQSVTQTTLGALSEYITSGSRDWSKYYATSGAMFIRTQDINQNRLSLDEVAHVELPAKVEGKRSLVRRGDLLITITGANVGKTAVVDQEIPEAYVSQSVCLVRLKDPSLSKFLHLQLIARRGDKSVLEAAAYGLGRPVLNLENIRSAPVKIAPLEVRAEVVAEVEKQFSRLDEAVANLKRVKAHLKRYKATALATAFASDRGWLWMTYADIGAVTTGFTPPTAEPANFGGTIPFFKPTDLDAGENVVAAREYLTAKGLAKGRQLPAGSVLVTCIGATIGKAGLAQVACATNQQINAVSPRGDVADSRFIYWWTVSPAGQQQIIENASATTLPILNKSKFSALRVPLPPLSEQRCIVAEIDRRLSIVREVEAEVDANLKRAQALRQAVLAKAFTVASDAVPSPA
jgi:hypothetical protein